MGFSISIRCFFVLRSYQFTLNITYELHDVQSFAAIQTLCYNVERNDVQQYPIYPITYYCSIVYFIEDCTNGTRGLTDVFVGTRGLTDVFVDYLIRLYRFV